MRYLTPAVALAALLGLSACAGGAGFDPIDSDQPNDSAGISGGQFEAGNDCPDEVEFLFGRNVEAESFRLDCRGPDGTGWTAAYSVEGSENTRTHTARAALAEALGQNLENATPTVADAFEGVVKALFPAGVP